MGQLCPCVQRPPKAKSPRSDSAVNRSLKDKRKSESGHRLQDNSSATIPNGDSQADADNPTDDIVESEDDEFGDEEYIDLSAFQDEVLDFIEFWHVHFQELQRDRFKLHHALVRRMHDKVIGTFTKSLFLSPHYIPFVSICQHRKHCISLSFLRMHCVEHYEDFPREAVDQFVRSIPDLLESLEALMALALDGDIDQAVDVFNAHRPTLINGVSNLPPTPVSRPIVHRQRSRTRRHRKADSISIVLTSAFIDGVPEHKPSTSPVPPSPPSQSKVPSISSSSNDQNHQNDRMTNNVRKTTPFLFSFSLSPCFSLKFPYHIVRTETTKICTKMK